MFKNLHPPMFKNFHPSMFKNLHPPMFKNLHPPMFKQLHPPMFKNLHPHKNLFLRKKSNRPRAALDLAKVEKGEVIPDNTAPKSYLPLFVKNPQYEFGDQTERQEK